MKVINPAEGRKRRGRTGVSRRDVDTPLGARFWRRDRGGQDAPGRTWSGVFPRSALKAYRSRVRRSLRWSGGGRRRRRRQRKGEGRRRCIKKDKQRKANHSTVGGVGTGDPSPDLIETAGAPESGLTLRARRRLSVEPTEASLSTPPDR